jgi:hypothetical protein
MFAEHLNFGGDTGKRLSRQPRCAYEMTSESAQRGGSESLTPFDINFRLMSVTT